MNENVRISINISLKFVPKCLINNIPAYGSDHEGASVLLPGSAIKWEQNQVTRQAHLRDLTHMFTKFVDDSSSPSYAYMHQ